MREYLYVPLGGNRKGRLRTYINLMAVMCIAGLWHGAAWSYAVWGAWHGAASPLSACWRRPAVTGAGGAYRTRASGFHGRHAGLAAVQLPHFSDVIAYGHALWDNRASRPNRQTM